MADRDTSNDPGKMFCAKRSENMEGQKERGITFAEAPTQYAQSAAQQGCIFPLAIVDRGVCDATAAGAIPPWVQRPSGTGTLYPPGQIPNQGPDKPPMGAQIPPFAGQGQPPYGFPPYIPGLERPGGSVGLFGTDQVRPSLPQYCPPRNIYEVRPPNPGKLTIEYNAYLTNSEIKTVTDICSDNYNSQDRNGDVADQLREIVQKRNKQIKWIVACGSMSTAQSVCGRDSVLFAKYGDLSIAVLKGTYLGGRVAPPSEDTPGAQVRDVKKLPPFRDPSTKDTDDATAQVLRHVVQKHDMNTAPKICSDLREILHKRDSSTAWLIVCGRQYNVSIDMGLENPGISYFGEMNQTRVTIIKMARNIVC